jgi:hypothetical protein
MHVRSSFVARKVLLWLAVFSAVQLACEGGHIPPSTFQFTTIVPHTGTGTGGWKVAQVRILLGRLSKVFPQAAVCDIEVGVPVRNVNGLVWDALAQEAAARASDEAARIVLRERIPTALACVQFRQHMERILGDYEFGIIPGAKVGGFQSVGVPRTTFPEKMGSPPSP